MAKRLLLVLLVAIACSYASTLVPTPHGLGWAAFHVPFILYVIFTVFHIGAATFFLSGLKGFTAALKKAYYFIAFGVVVLGLSQLQVSILQAVYLWSTPWVNWGGTSAPYFVSALLVFIGTLRFGKLLNVRSPWSKSFVILFFSLVAIGAAVALPHASSASYGLSNLQYRWRAFIINGTWALSLLTVAVAWKLAQAIGAFYRQSMRWFLAAVAGTAVCNTQTAVFAYAGYSNFYITSGMSSLVYVFASLLYLRAGYVFMKMSQTSTSKNLHFTSVDLITYAASLVSTPQAIDVYLDRLREITARQGGLQLTTADQEALLRLYLEIEDYLAAKEPVRPYPKERLRAQIEHTFDFEHNAEPVFWASLPRN